jgi:4'-phosphopantetheinyl transferase
MIDGVHLWRAALDEEGWPDSRELPLGERRRAEAFLRKGAGRRWVAARWALRRTLARYLDLPAAGVELEISEHGKPRLLDDSSGLEFSLAHSEGLALVAVTERRQVGVDVEAIAPRADVLALAERALPAEEVEAIRGADRAGQLSAFYTAWVRHEARVKCLGTGLGAPAPTAPVSVETIEAAPGYAAAVAVAGPAVGPLECRTLRAC